MAPTTRATLNSLQHVIFIVLKLEEAKYLVQAALAKDDILTLPDFVSLPPNQIDQLTYTETKETGDTDVSIGTTAIGWIKAFQSFLIHLHTLDQHPGLDEDKWRAITSNAYDSYRVGSAFLVAQTGITAPSNVITPART